jgi:hypothetical protein
MIIVFAGFFYQQFIAPWMTGKESVRLAQIAEREEAQYALWVIAIVAVGLIIATWFGERRWLARGPTAAESEVDYPVTHPRPEK